MKKKLDLLPIFFIVSALFLSHVQSLAASLPKYETQYFMELPSAFLNTLNKDELGNAVLWHPRLTVTKVHTLHDDPSSFAQFKEEPVKDPNSNFLSFLQIKQTNQGTDRLTFIPGNPNITDSAIQASKMNCECRFVKDSNPFTLLQTQTSPAPDVQAQTQAEPEDSPNLIQTETEKAVSSSPIPLDQTSTTQTAKTEKEDIESLSMGSFENPYQEGLEQLVQKNELLKAQLENQSLKEALEKERLEKEREELLKNFELSQKLKASPSPFPYQNSKNNDYLLALLRQSEETSNSNNLDMNDFYEFQKYQQYKSMMTMQNSNTKNLRLGSFQGYNDRQQSDYNLVERIASVKDEALRRELIKAFID